jgi:hypothetical protein
MGYQAGRWLSPATAMSGWTRALANTIPSYLSDIAAPLDGRTAL